MLYWALIFFIISLVSYGFGAYGIAGLTMDVAQFLFFTFLILAGILLAIAFAGVAKLKSIFKS